MEKLTISYHDTQTDEVIVRDMTDEEIAQHNAIVAERDQFRQQQIQTANAKAALLEKLGITADEAALLIS
jgi:hypothetical protein